MTEVALADGGRLAVTTAGSGPPILLLRPLGGSSASWEPFAGMLARRFRVVTFDPRGAGCSSPAPLPTTTRAMAEDARAVLDALALRRVHVYGLSLGGMVAAWLAVDAPERVDRLVLASTAAAGWRVAAGGWRRALRFARCFARRARAAEACLAAAVLSDAFRAAHPDEVARIRARAQARPASHRGLLTLLAAAATHDCSERLAAIDAPTLVLAGAADALLPEATQRRVAAAIPGARFALVPGAGHDVSAERPDVVARLVSEHARAP